MYVRNDAAEWAAYFGALLARADREIASAVVPDAASMRVLREERAGIVAQLANVHAQEMR